MPQGTFAVDGFILVYDVSMVPNRSPEKQTEFCAQILSNIMKCRPPKPCVIAATKCDEANEILVRELERLVNRKGIKCYKNYSNINNLYIYIYICMFLYT
jgi:hypothetical protein